MRQLSKGMTIMLTDGRRVKVKELLGEGAQGWVYLVDCPERPHDIHCNYTEMALKWYKKSPSQEFLDNLTKNAADGAPSAHFIWPEAVCRRQIGSAGYLMKLRPSGFHELSDFRLAKVRFQSFSAILRACIETCEAFRQLHARGLSYQDLNDGGFFINPKTGQVYICDNDNVFPNGENSGVAGKARYMAPEVVSGASRPDTYSDRFSLSVILFMYLFIDHPFEGANVLNHPCLTEEIERKLFGEDLCFIFDDSKKNPPVEGVHNNVLLFWPMWPDSLKQLFKQEFSAKKLRSPQTRLTELEWISQFMMVRDQLVLCPCCTNETFVGRNQYSYLNSLSGKTERCIAPRCKKPVEIKFYLVKGSRAIPLLPGSFVYFDNAFRVSGLVQVNISNNDGMLLLCNYEESAWQITTPSGKVVSLQRHEYMPVKAGLKIQNANGVWEIVSVK